MAEPVELTSVTYADIANVESQLQDIDAAVSAFQDLLSQRAYKKRVELASKIPHFWAIVLEAAPPDIDQRIQPSDSEVLGACLTSISVDRFEQTASPEIFTKLALTGDAPLDVSPLGEPRSFSLRFEFSDNEWFEDKVLEKKFWFRRARDGWAGIVSEPVKIQWKAGKDLTEGLLDSAVALWETQKKAGFLKGDGSPESKKHEEKAKELPEYEALADRVEDSPEGSLSFFTFFGYRGRWISEEESKIACKEHAENIDKAASGANGDVKEEDVKKEEDEDENVNDDDDEDLTLSQSAAEIFFDGDDFATTLADDVFPHATQYFIQAQEDDGALSAGSFDEDDLELMDADDDDEDEDDDEDMGEANLEAIRQLAKRKGRKSGDEVPTKKSKA